MSLFPQFASDATTDVSVVVVSYNTKHLLERMLTALDAGRGQLQLQIIVVDNASKDDSAAFLKREFPHVELIENPTNVGFGRANNQALSSVRGRYVLLLNTDAFVSPDTLPRTVNYMDEHPRSGVLGVKLIDESGVLQPSCFHFPTPWNIFLRMSRLDRFFKSGRLFNEDHESLRACDWVKGCYYLMRREITETIGLFDPRYFLYYEEVDHCRRVHEAGWDVIYYPHAPVVHIGAESAKSYNKPLDRNRQVSILHIESELLYLRKHHGMFGLMASVLLTMMADVGLVLKRVVLREKKQVKEPLSHARLIIKLLVDTKLASRPTR